MFPAPATPTTPSPSCARDGRQGVQRRQSRRLSPRRAQPRGPHSSCDPGFPRVPGRDVITLENRKPVLRVFMEIHGAPASLPVTFSDYRQGSVLLVHKAVIGVEPHVLAVAALQRFPASSLELAPIFSIMSSITGETPLSPDLPAVGGSTWRLAISASPLKTSRTSSTLASSRSVLPGTSTFCTSHIHSSQFI
jgi:hypothetical protein